MKSSAEGLKVIQCKQHQMTQLIREKDLKSTEVSISVEEIREHLLLKGKDNGKCRGIRIHNDEKCWVSFFWSVMISRLSGPGWQVEESSKV